MGRILESGPSFKLQTMTGGASFEGCRAAALVGELT